MLHVPIPDEDRLREQIATADLRGRIITDPTARELAAWLAAATGPGFNAFVTTTAVTAELYAELARFYDVRRPESERWLDALLRYAVRQRRQGSSQGPLPLKADQP